MKTFFSLMVSDDPSVSHKRFIGLCFAALTMLILMVGVVAIFLKFPATPFCALAGISGGVCGGALGFSAWQEGKKTITTFDASTLKTIPVVETKTGETPKIPTDK